LHQHSTPKTQLTIAHYFLFLLLFMAFFLTYQMMKAYLDPVIIAIILSVLCNPVYQWLKTKCRGRRKTAALISCMLLIMVIIIPLTLVFLAVIKQGILSFNAINQWVSQGNIQKLIQSPYVDRILALWQEYMQVSLLKGIDLNNVMITISSSAGELLMNQGKYLIGNISSVVGKFFLMSFVFFFAIQEQEKRFQYISHLIPLSSAHERIVVNKIKAVAKSALLGTLVTSASQGIAGGLAFTICGLPGVFWGAVMAFASLIPVVGTALIWVPAALWLFISGSWGYGMFMVIWSVVVVGMIDNLVRPLFMKGSADMSTVLIFFSILGGINYFGLTGLLYGPMVFGLTLVLLYIYDLEFHVFLDQQDQS
jgi:predicted PurR-regulated permease PerM